MKTDRRNKKGTLLIIAGLLLMAAALALVLYNKWDSDRARRVSEDILSILEGQIDGTEKISTYENMPAVEIDGNLYIGIIEIPELGLKLPVMAEWDYDKLKLSPCRYSGSYFTDDMVICAHNYPSHFGPIKQVAIGADVYFKTVTGTVFRYQVSNRQTMEPSEVEEMVDDTDESWDLTLFTCNIGGKTRCAVRCVK